MTIGSFVSVSLDPPLVGFFIGTGSRSWAAISPTGRFCVNVLAAGQDEICWRFAKEGDDKFSGLRWSPTGLGNPAIEGCAAHIDCSIESATPAGDHAFVLGRVHDLSGAEAVDSAMVFFRGRVAGISPEG
jgi:flavin reductase (DIM6/NTAB) family NADH-FMN oxidoreductase RutF